MHSSRFTIKRDPRNSVGWIVIEVPPGFLLEPARAIAVFADWPDAIRWAQERANPWRDRGRPTYADFNVEGWAMARAAMKTLEKRGKLIRR